MRSRLGYGQGPLIIFVLVATALMLTVSSMARMILVGGSEGWHYGFDCSKWAFQFGYIYVGDILGFKYPQDSTSFKNCNLAGATKVGNERAVSGEGFKFVIDKVENYYFACGVENYCNNGKMKFTVPSVPRGIEGKMKFPVSSAPRGLDSHG